MSARSAAAKAIEWRDPVVLALVALFIVNLIPLSSAIRAGTFAEATMSLGVCYAIAVAAVGVSRDGVDGDVLGLAFGGGLAAFVAGAFALDPASRYAALAAAFGACSLYSCRRLVGASARTR